MDFWDDVERLASSLGRISYLELLGVDDDVFDRGLALTDAYHAALRRYHPDRHAVGSTPAQKQALARICARVGEAYRVLSTPATRAEYLASLARDVGPAVAARTRTKRRSTLMETRDPKGEKARSLLASAQALVRDGNRAAARAKLDLALQFEPDSKALRALRDEVSQPGPATPSASEDASKDGEPT